MKGPRLLARSFTGPLALLGTLAGALSCDSGGSAPGGGAEAGAPALDAAAAEDVAVVVDDGGNAVDAAMGLSRGQLLGAFAGCVQSTVRRFGEKAAALETATAELAAAPDPARWMAARAAFVEALDTWEEAEVMQLGPAAPGDLAGGQNLRDQIYFWPLDNPCVVEGELVNRGYQAPTFPMSLANRRGLAAMESLLYYEGTASLCAPGSAAATGWTALPAEEREARRRAYAAVAAADVRRRATTLADAWDPAKGNFGAALASAGPGNKTYPTTQAGLNAVSDAVLYVDNEMKDMKIARPVGLRECATGTCPERLESRFAHRSKANLKANLLAVRRLIEGCQDGFAGPGFDDLLEAVGAGAVAGRLRERLAAAQAALEAIEESDLAEAIAADAASVRTLHARLKDVTDVLKTEFLSVLDLEIPKKLEGDND